MSASEQYQAIVIGSGQGGTPLCMALARRRPSNGADRTRTCGRNLHQRRLHADENHGRKRPRRLPRAARRRLRRSHGKHPTSTWNGSGSASATL